MKYVKCGECRSYFETSIIKVNGDTCRAYAEDAVLVADTMIKCMMWVALADGDVQPSEIDLLHSALNQLSTSPVSKEVVEEAVKAAEIDVESGKLEKDLNPVVSKLSDESKALIFKASLAVAAADNEIQPEEQEVLERMMNILQGS